MRVILVRPSSKHESEFVQAYSRSRSLYRNLMTPVEAEKGFVNLLKRVKNPRSANFFVALKDSQELVGAIHVENIVHGLFQSATLGYYAFLPHAGTGLMREGMIQVISHAFKDLKLHRLEANIQPINSRSIELLKGLGFQQEGYSPRFLKICGRWRDHERWALLAEQWQPSRL